MSQRGMALGLFVGGFAAAVGAYVVAAACLRQHDWTGVPVLAAGFWGALSVSQLWARYDRYERILREHGLLPKD